MKCNKCGGELDMTMMYMSMPPQYKCKVCGSFSGEDKILKNGDIIKGDLRNIQQACKCCNGVGVQQGNDGIKVRCQECDGTGYWNVFKEGMYYNSGDYTCRKDKKLTDYKIGDDLNALKVGDFPNQINITNCENDQKTNNKSN